MDGKVPGDLLLRLCNALTKAFHTRGELERLARFHLDVRLSHVTSEGSLHHMIFELVEWAESRDRLPDLAAAAMIERSSNSDLPPIHAQLCSHLGGVQSLSSLPGRASLFVGYGDVLTQARAEMMQRRGTRVAVCLFRGPGGAGKSTVALELAHDLAPEFPNGQYRVDLKGVVSHDAAQAEVARVMAWTKRLSEVPRQRADEYRGIFQGGQVLLLLDNVDSREQLEVLVPPPGCGLIATSRKRIRLRGYPAYDLSGLPLPQAEALLKRLAPRVGDDARSIIEVCGRLPLAIHVAADVLDRRPDWSVEQFLARWRLEAFESLGEIERAIAVSESLLADSLRSRWRDLAVFEKGFDKDAACALWETPRDQVDVDLGTLLGASLLECRDRVYLMHEMIREYARSRYGRETQRLLNRRYALYLIRRTIDPASLAACVESDTFASSDPSAHPDQTRNEPEWESMADPCRQEANAGVSAVVIGNVLSLWKLPPDERIVIFEDSLAAARQIADKIAEGKHLSYLATAYRDRGDLEKAIAHYKHGLVIARELGRRRSEGIDLDCLGIVFRYQGRLDEAAAMHEQALAIAREDGDRAGEGYVLGNLGLVYTDIDPRRAIDYQKESLVIAREFGDLEAEARTLNNLGEALSNLGETTEAIDYFEAYAACLLEVGSPRDLGIAYGNLGNAYRNMGDYGRAIVYYEKSLECAREQEDRRVEAITLLELARTYHRSRQLKRARELACESRIVARRVGYRQIEKDASKLIDEILSEEAGA